MQVKHVSSVTYHLSNRYVKFRENKCKG